VNAESSRRSPRSPALVPGDGEAEALARSLLAKHGATKLREILAMLRRNAPGTEIAEACGVTKQRVSQWRRVLGEESTTFEVRRCVTDVAKSGM
jgi:hypothetical protein